MPSFFKNTFLKNLMPLFGIAIFLSTNLAQGQAIKQEIEDRFGFGVVYRINVSPSAEMKPAFKHRFTVQPHKTIPGNAITHYLRSLGENSLNGPVKAVEDQFGFESHGWYDLETDVKDIPLEDLRTASGYFDSYVKNHLSRATLCRECDWGLAVEDLRGPESIEFLLPSVQQTRSMSRALSLRHRLAIIDGRFEDAVANLRINFQLGQNVGKLQFLVADLVGIAICGIAQECVVDFINAKDSPNLYWALAELPTPVVGIRDSLRLEASLPERYFPELENIETAEYSDEKWNELLVSVINSVVNANQMMYSGNRDDADKMSSLSAAGLSMLAYGGAKQRLIDSGMNKDEVEDMAVGQVILIDTLRDLRMISDEVQKQFYVPYGSIKDFEEKLEELEQAQGGVPSRMGVWIGSMFAPAVQQVQAAEIRCQARTNILMAVESIRNHIATHNEFPNSLDELELPVRDNPFTGEAFPYMVKDGVATLEIPKSEMNYNTQRFELRMAK